MSGRRFTSLLILLPVLFSAPATADDIKEGAALYRQMCKHCHGPKMVNAGTSSYNLSVFPRDQGERFYRSLTKGKGKMPPMGDLLKPFEMDQLWAYVSSRGGKIPPIKKKLKESASNRKN